MKIINQTGAFARNYAQAGFFFPIANGFNFAQAADPDVIKVAAFNILYSTTFITGKAILTQFSKTESVLDSEAIDEAPQNENPSRPFLKFLAGQVDPMRVTAICTTICGVLLLKDAAHGIHEALYPGLAALAFSCGNWVQSSPTIQKLHEKLRGFGRIVTHAASSYGPGYMMTGIGIAGGLSLANMSAHPAAAFLTTIGIIETGAALGLLATEKVRNEAAPFVVVAAGTTLFAITGALLHNWLGVGTGVFACAGEVSLAVLMQKFYNKNHKPGDALPTKLENWLTTPIRGAMRRGWIKPTPPTP